LEKYIELGHGNGGIMTHSLIRDLFMRYFNHGKPYRSEDSALLDLEGNQTIAFTTDSFVITPLFFNGGNIGKLAVCGTVNDLAVSGAEPKYLSCSFILEEGLPIVVLEEIVRAMADAAEEAGVVIVTGDTKVAERGKVDKIYINTSGIGIVKCKSLSTTAGDQIIITGTLGDHGTSILLSRENLNIGTEIVSDCAPLSGMLLDIWARFAGHIKLMKDPTRGGLATTLNEILAYTDCGILIEENALPFAPQTRSVCNMLGLDPLYLANEGKAIIVTEGGFGSEIVSMLQKHPYGKNSAVIGTFSEATIGRVALKTVIGTIRLLDMLYSDPLPRIC
jgi:hydrogenase expression/formation protein HypE